MPLVENAFRIKKEIDIFKDFLNVSVKFTYEKFIKSDFISVLHEMIILEASEAEVIEGKSAGIINRDPLDTYHEFKNKFHKASMKSIAGDPFDQNITVLIKWDAEYYYVIFMNNGKVAESIYSELVKHFTFLEEYSSYNHQHMDRQKEWSDVLGETPKAVDLLQFELLSYKRIEEWIMEPIFGLQQAENWTYKFK